MKARKTPVALTEEQKRKAVFTREELGPVLYAKLSLDPNYALMCMFCRNFGKLVAEYIEHRVPETGRFRSYSRNFDNYMWAWEIDVLYLTLEPGYQDDSHRMLYAQVNYPTGSDRLISALLYSGTRQEILDYMRSPEFGPRFMTVMDELNSQAVSYDW